MDTEKLSILKFCELNNINWMPIDLNAKKQPVYSKLYNAIPKQSDFRDCPEVCVERQKFVNDFEFIGIDTTDFIHIDVDFENEKWEQGKYKKSTDEHVSPAEFVEQLVNCGVPYYRSVTKKHGKHFIINKDNFKFLSLRPQTVYEDIEILAGQWAYCLKKRNVNFSSDMVLDNKSGFFNTILPDSESSLKEKDINSDSGISDNDDPVNHNELEDILNNIDIKYVDEYDSWTKIIWGLRNNSKTNKKLARRFSKRSEKYDEDSFLNLWNNCRSGNSIATIYYYSKKSNKLAFHKIKSKYMSIDSYLGTDDYLARLFLEDNGVCYVYKNDTLYTYNKKVWSVDKSNNKLCCYISSYLFELLNVKLMSLNRLISTATMDNDQTKIKSLQEQRKFINGVITSVLSTSKIVKISQRIIHLLSCEDFDHIEFDSNPNLFCFNNKCYDLKLGTWIKPRREDYILTTSRYNYEISSPHNLTELSDLIKQIFPDEDIRKTYVSYMATSLFGIPIEKFIIANGSGGNGKGVLNELLVECLGEYAYTAPNDLLLNSIKSGNNPAVANMNNKRLVIYREPDSENQKLCGAAIKEITGGSQINARMNYSNDTKTNLRATHILECNKKPKIDGRKDDSIERRLVDIPFKSTFTNKKELLDQDLDYVYKANIYYKSDEFKKQFKSTLFDYLINFIKGCPDICNNPYTCEEVIQRTKEYIQDSDDLYGILSESVEKTGDKTDYISCKDLYNIYKSSEYFYNLSKKQKREQNYKWFRLELLSNNNYKI